MKPRIFFILGALVLATMLPATAQAQNQLLFRLSIPFAFIASGTHMPPGDYVGFHASPAIIQLVREDGRASVWIPVKASSVATEETKNQIVFNRYGDTYFLAKVNTGQDQQMHESFRCRAEETLAAQYAPEKPDVIVLAAQ